MDGAYKKKEKEEVMEMSDEQESLAPVTSDREARIAALAEKLAGLDESRLAEVEEWLGREAAGPLLSGAQPLTRRQLLAGALVGGAGLVVGGLGGGIIGNTIGDSQGAERARREAEARIAKLEGLVRLYETLEKVGIDAVIATGLAALDLIWKGVKAGGEALKQAVGLVDAGLVAIENSLPTLRTAVTLVEGLLSLLEGNLKLLQAQLAQVSGTLRPLTDALGGFLNDLIGRIPFGVGDAIIAANKRLIDLVSSLPNALEGMQNLLTALKNDWLVDDPNKGLKGRLLEPARGLVKGLSELLDKIGQGNSELDQKLLSPSRAALAERERIRKEISQYRAANALAWLTGEETPSPGGSV